MVSFIMLFFLFLVSFLFSNTSFAEQIPDWVKQTPLSDGKYQYFVGTGSGKTKNKAIESAQAKARDEACLSLGSEIHVETTYVVRNDDEDTDDRSKISCSARLKKFDRAKEPFCQKLGKDEYYCDVLYRYPLEERRKEEKRLDETSGNVSAEMNVIGNDPRNGILIVDTGNVVADLYIDGEKAGKTPIKLVGVVEPEKKHKIKIDSPAHEIFEKEIVVYKNVENEITDPVLIPAYAQISFEIDPDEDDVVLKADGRKIKPGQKQKIPAGKKIKIEASHPRYKTVSSEYTFNRGEKRTVRVPLLEKDADLYLIVSRPEYRVEVDGKVDDSKDRERHFRLSPGKHKITVYAGKSKTVSDTVTLKPADKLTFEINEDFLKSKKKEKEKRNFLPAVFVPPKSEEPFVGQFDLSRMLANIDFSYLVPRLSYDTRSGGVRFTVTVETDPKKYRENFVDPLKKALLRTSYSASKIKEENLSLRCVAANNQPQRFCGVKPLSGPTTAYIRTGEPVAKLLSREAPFAVIADIPDWAAGYEDMPVKKLEVFFALFDKNKKNLFARSVPFTLIPFQIVGNMYVFSPVMTDAEICRKTDMFGGAEEFACGATVFQAQTEKVRIDLNRVAEIYISVGAAK